MNHSQNDDALASARQRLNRVSNDVGKPANRLLVGSRNTASSASSHLPDGICSRVYALKNFPRGNGVVRGDVGNG